ncbi:MAG: type IV pili methyl-accepting chemotaxis transducer N-terminal domain-containing protein [Burkholderiales bacterium]|nr:type IV pili methyl-accepting chemotaxis transducer N-terminal domain-containing protein [Burkholderiales bacterium]
MRRPPALAAKLVAIGTTFLVLALASIGLTLWVTWQLEGGAAAINEAGRLRMQTWRLAMTLDAGELQVAARLADELDGSLELLRVGDPSRPLFVAWEAPARAQFDKVAERWRELRARWLPRGDERTRMAADAGAFVAEVDRLVLSIERQLSYWTAVLNLVQLAMMALAIGSAVVLLYLGHLFVLDPLARLKDGLKKVEEGDLSARVDVASRDEFGELSAGFNRMAGNLESAYQNLEQKVREKTASLEVERARLAALYDVSAFLAKAATLDELAKGFARRVREIAHADAAAVRWSDEANRHYLLMAGDCLPEAMAKDEHCLLTGSCHCGQPRATARARVIPIRTAEPAPFDHCARAGFETLVTVPVLLQGRVLGEIDLFYRKVVTLTDEERGLLDALSSHLASAMEGRRASALEREAAVADERGLLARELHDSIAQSLAFLKIQAQLLREALGAGDHARAQTSLVELDAGLRESTGDVRELLMHFRTRTNAEDIEPALQHTLKKFEHQTGLATHLAIEGHGLPLDADVQVQVLHVVQEALSNVRKHAGATAVWIEVQRAPQWRFEVRDDGRGFADAADGTDETHVGLRIMKERARRIGASVEIDSVPGAGTCVSLILPAQKTAASSAAASA